MNDGWIFCLAVLLSSTLVYNSRGTIDNTAVEKLQYPLTTQPIPLSHIQSYTLQDAVIS